MNLVAENFVNFFMEKKDQSYIHEFKFLADYSNFDEKVYCICEGQEDMICYLPKIKSILKKEVKIYSVDGKDNVIKVYEHCSKNSGYNFSKIMFLVDKDFDESIQDDKIYELPVYSLENLYARPEVLEDFLRVQIGVENEKVSTMILTNYSEREKEFNNIIQLLNINMYITKKIFENDYSYKGRRYHDLILPSICDDDVKNNINITLTEVDKTVEFDLLISSFEFIRSEDVEELKNSIFSITNSRDMYKGKYQFYFFISYIKSLLIDVNKGGRKAGERIIADKNYGCSVDTKDQNLFGILSNYIQMPNCFELYISKFK